MSKKLKKRPWFQYHLSTAIIMMFVAGGLMWPNLRAHVLPHEEGDCHCFDGQEWYGFPFDAATNAGFDPENNFRIDWDGLPAEISITGPTGYKTAYVLPCALDGFVLLATVLIAAFLCEWRIRRREPQHNNTTIIGRCWCSHIHEDTVT